MGTEFQNYVDKDGQGAIVTLSEWSVWDCVGKKWSSTPPVTLRNILLAASHPTPEDRFCIAEIPEKATDAALLNPFLPPKATVSYQLEMASGSRTHGRFTYSTKPVGLSYYGEQWKRIIYGSIMHTGCKKLVYKDIKFVITDDSMIDGDGFQQDDPVNGKNWGTGDSHAKASASFMNFLSLEQYIDPDPYRDQDPVGNVDTPIQFRVSEFLKWVGKGTVAYSPEMDATDVDIAIPLSSCKGNKPALGYHTAKLLFGVVFEAEERRAKPGWMLIQWFSFETLQLDNVISNLETKCQRLNPHSAGKIVKMLF